MDVTHIISSPDYFTKDSTGLTEVLKTAVKQLSDDMDMREKCNKLADMFMSYRQVGEMEVGKTPKKWKMRKIEILWYLCQTISNSRFITSRFVKFYARLFISQTIEKSATWLVLQYFFCKILF